MQTIKLTDAANSYIMKIKLMTSSLVAGAFSFAAVPANAANVLIEYDFVDLTGMTIGGDTLTYTGSNVDGTELEVKVVASYFGTPQFSPEPNITDFGLSVKAGPKGGTRKNKNLGYDGDTGWYEIMTFSFDKDVTLNQAGEIGSFVTKNATGGEMMRWVSSEGTDEGKGTISFSNLTTLAAGDTLTVTAWNGGASSTMSLTDLSVFTASSIAAIPEPSTTVLLGLGGLALILRRRK